MAEFDLYASCRRGFPHWMWRTASGQLTVSWDGGSARVDWFERSTVVVPDDVDSIRFTFVASNQPFARSPRVAVATLRDEFVIYRASLIPLFFRPTIWRIHRSEPVPDRWSSWPATDDAI